MNFWQALKNDLRCLFCKESYCHVKYRIGRRHFIRSDYDSGVGGYYYTTRCPKDRKSKNYKSASKLREEILSKNKK